MEEGSDLHTYIQRFENSYCGFLIDVDKIYKFGNKMCFNDDIKDEARRMAETFKDWVRFRNEILKRCGKKASQVRAEV